MKEDMFQLGNLSEAKCYSFAHIQNVRFVPIADLNVDVPRDLIDGEVAGSWLGGYSTKVSRKSVDLLHPMK